MSGKYTIEYAKSGRAKCMACKEPIDKDEVRQGVQVTMPGSDTSSYKWRHLGCMTAKVVQHIGSPEELAGLEDLDEEDQERVRQLFESPPEAKPRAKKGKKAGGEGEGEAEEEAPKPKAKKGGGKKKAAEAEEAEGEEEAPKAKKAKKQPAAKKGKKKAAEEEEKAEEEAGEEEELPAAEEEEEQEEEEEEPAPTKKGKKSGGKKSGGKKSGGKNRHRFPPRPQMLQMSPDESEAGAPASEAPLGIWQLPEDALVNVLGHLELQERLTTAALVCRRLRDLCLIPQLLRTVRVEATGGRVLPVARSLLPWLGRHAPHVRRLTLRLELHDIAPEAERSELGAAIVGCVMACGAVGQLQELELEDGTADAPLSWLPALRSLRRVEAHGSDLRLTADASRHGALRDMRLDCGKLIVDAAARLPLSLTSLSVCDHISAHMPEQLALVPGLRRLSISCAAYSAHSMAKLARLTALTRLSLDGLEYCPPAASLAALSSLRHLRFSILPPFGPARAVTGELAAALPSMQHLTYLAIKGNGPLHQVVAALPQLQRLFVWREAEAAAEQLPLPPGFPRLRCLGLDWRTTAASVPALAAMPELQELCLPDAPAKGSVAEAQWDAFWAWAATHPPLRSLCLASDHPDRSRNTVCSHMSLASLRLQRARPALLVAQRTDCPLSLKTAFYGSD